MLVIKLFAGYMLFVLGMVMVSFVILRLLQYYLRSQIFILFVKLNKQEIQINQKVRNIFLFSSLHLHINLLWSDSHETKADSLMVKFNNNNELNF